MMSLNRSSRLLIQQCRRSLTSASVFRRKGVEGAGGALALVPHQLHNDSSQSKRTMYATTDQHYSSFSYRTHPSAPVTVGWVNLEQQQLQQQLMQQQQSHQRTQRLARTARGGGATSTPQDNNKNELFYGLPLRVDEPPPTTASTTSAATGEDADSAVVQKVVVAEGDSEPVVEERLAMNRNARRAKGPNRGKRAVSRIARREKKRSIGNHRR